jgi:hypothetical protein
MNDFYCKKRGLIDTDHCKLCHSLLVEQKLTSLTRKQCKDEHNITNSEMMDVQIICSYCKKEIRVAQWPKTERTGWVISHGICSECKLAIDTQRASERGNA